MTREKTTAEMAHLIGAPPDLLRKWKRRGFLPIAAREQDGAGHGTPVYWSIEAQAELLAFAKTRNYGPTAENQRLSTPTRKNRPQRRANRPLTPLEKRPLTTSRFQLAQPITFDRNEPITLRLAWRTDGAFDVEVL
jgi:hypothetical protein